MAAFRWDFSLDLAIIVFNLGGKYLFNRLIPLYFNIMHISFNTSKVHKKYIYQM